MRWDVIRAHLMAMRSAVDAIIIEMADEQAKAEQRPQCCAQPMPVHEQSYGAEAWHCGNCGTTLSADGAPDTSNKAGPGIVSGQEQSST